ncbi:MAG: rod shape-determining protein MreD [Candidatus Kapabacteria bacterium]|nr:rod shape-determining protein MreD [Candidatus Kapabacteria bacterium]MCS7169487.1 rod shape-determining protein MreD [Candidatus Kapabacteria bacterium]MDW7996544.1 rod shape-determining protein MreD [Bacteroidota bacterium]MDW8225435.1 rod shape-determining protein MreD [Bacteroidota bacterium]
MGSPLPGARVWLRLLGYGITALLGALVHVLLLPWIAAAGIVPDVLLLLTFWIALREGQMAGTAVGFAVGLLVDVVTQGQVGLNAFAKTVSGFIVGFFAHPEDPEWLFTVDFFTMLGIVTLGSAVHNVLYFALFVHPLEVSPIGFVLKYAGAATAYTVVVAALLFLGGRLLRRRAAISEQ